jgi:hypothetical protein
VEDSGRLYLLDRVQRRFMEGVISKEVMQIQSKTEDDGKCKLSVAAWCAGLVTRLLEVTHGQ